MNSGFPKNLTVACTGASGAVLTRELLRAVEADGRVERVNFIVSDGGLRVMAEEMGIGGRSELVKQLVGTAASAKIVQQGNDDIGANVASGSYAAEAMIVMPCSMGTLARTAHGMANNLIERAADVMLKERRRLVLCVRETPFSLIHLRNMTLAAEAGATIYPVMPAFYSHPADTEEMARQFVLRVLAHVGLAQDGMYRWKGGE